MKTTLKLLGTLVVSLFVLTTVARADTVYYDGMITAKDPTSHVTGQSTVGSGMQYYDLYSLTVSASGSYVFELSSRNTAGTPSNALDTWIAIFANTFNPPGPPQNSNDDFTGTLTVLPGPYAPQGYTSTSTGFSGAQPGSRLATVNLTAGTQYFVYVSSFRDTTFVSTTSNAQATGPYVGGINGPGTISLSVVPEPSTVALLGLAGVAGLVFARRKSRAS